MNQTEKQGYTFDHQIVTDGVSASILFNRKVIGPVRSKKGAKEPYITDLDTDAKREKVADKVLVGIDPNVSDLLFCVDSDKRGQRKLRYTQDTRRFETYSSKNRKALEKKKRANILVVNP